MDDLSDTKPRLPLEEVQEQPIARIETLHFIRSMVALLRRIYWPKVGLFTISLMLFILAITLMKEGARDLAPLVRNTFTVTNAANSLGFGWLFAYVVMSGSPVAAAALTFFDVGIIDQPSTFTMITGSRLGASFIVLFIGFIYVLKGRNWANSLGMGLLSLTVTGATYLLSLAIGLGLLLMGALDSVQVSSSLLFTSVTDLLLGTITQSLVSLLPGWGVFLLGLGMIMASFQLFDKCLPDMTLKESQIGRLSIFVYRPWVIFILGAAITLISMSVSVSLSILVPLSNRGFVRRENVIPYIMGANITTFIDTLFAAVLLNNSQAFTVVLAEMISITIVSILILSTFYHRYERAMLGLVSWITARNRNLLYFIVVILIVPVTLLLL